MFHSLYQCGGVGIVVYSRLPASFNCIARQIYINYEFTSLYFPGGGLVEIGPVQDPY